MGKASRRKKKEKKRIPDPGIPNLDAAVRRFFESVFQDQTSRTGEWLKEDSSREGLRRTGARVCGTFEEIQVSMQHNLQPRLDCGKGCAFCCYPPVSANLPEILNLLAYLEENGMVEEARLRVREVYERTQAMTAHERNTTSIACPMLVDGACSVYPARPLACRGFNSADAGACEAGYLNPKAPPSIPSFTPLLVAAQGLKLGVREGLAEERLESELLDLTKALHMLLEGDADDLVARWRAGEKVFRPARAFGR